ncbi:MAG TPA: hypothetical protein VNQ73_08255 [Ilumatobacter sp.]|nr:hypothetical protein [Ilumatobacter sp.]
MNGVPPSFLLSSRDPLPEATVFGHAFQGVDLAIGQEGAAAYATARGRQVEPGGDGAYVAVANSPRGVAIGTDRAGYGRLFEYRHGSDWILGTSLIEVVEQAAKRRWPLTPNTDHFQTFLMRGSLGNQLVTHRTVFDQITLVPANRHLAVTKGWRRAKLEHHPYPDATGPGSTSYPALLAECISLLVGRMSTLLRSGVSISSDITGGRDSRVILAALLCAHDHTGRKLGDLVRFTCSPRPATDLPVAQDLSGRYDLGVNSRSGPTTVPRSAVDNYRLWRRECLGVYGPIYLPNRASPEIGMGGAGGEAARLFYKQPTIDSLLKFRGRHFYSAEALDRVRKDLEVELRQLDTGFEAGLDPRILHYRYFRDRLHGGRMSQLRTTIAPLASHVLRKASTALGAELRERSQVIADLMLNLAPELAEVPYETEAKSFDQRHHDDAVDVRFAVRQSDCTGQVFGQPLTPASPPATTDTAALPVLYEAFERAAWEVRSRPGFPEHIVERAEPVARQAAETGRFTHPADAQPVHAVILAAEILRLS